MQIDWVQAANILFSSFVTACFTIIGGVIVLALSQIATKLFVEPILEQARIVGEVAHSVTYFANVYGGYSTMKDELVQEASTTLRRQASQLRASAWTIRWYCLWQLLGLVKKRESILKVSQNLIGLSNSMGPLINPTHIHEWQEEIKTLLGFRE